jgi:CRISPR system Cascade subunit CasC
MPSPRFLQIHFLASYPGVLLNRDDAGLAKRLPFGPATRTRISSQCLKRHWRMVDDARAIHQLAKAEGIESERSKEVIERLVTKDLRADHDQAVVKAVEDEFVKAVYGKNGVDKKKRQALLLGRPEVDWLAQEARRLVEESPTDAGAAGAAAEAFLKGERNNIAQLRSQNALAAGLEAALFGRMVTSDKRANTDAAIHVAHAFTVHDEQPELDYFTVVDDLTGRSEENEEGGTGAAGVFDSELTSGLYYGYVVIDVPLLVSNLTGVRRAEWDATDTDRSLAARVVENLVHLIATVSPGAKKGSTAPYAWADAVLVEAGDRQPRTLANAFRDDVPLQGEGTLLGRTARALSRELAELDAMFGPGEARLLAAREDAALLGTGVTRMTLPELATRAGALVRDAAA